MYTVEFDHDEVCITIMDDSGNHTDLVINSFDDIVYLRQWEEETDTMQVIDLSPEMWEELMLSFNSAEGFFKRV